MSKALCLPCGLVFAGLLGLGSLCLLAGCSAQDAAKSDPQTVDSENKALSDPFGYSPNFDGDDVENSSDMKKDLNFVAGN